MKKYCTKASTAFKGKKYGQVYFKMLRVVDIFNKANMAKKINQYGFLM